MKRSKTDTPQKFEDALKRLEAIVQQMESGDLLLDDALSLFEEGMRLTRYCQIKLDQAQKRVELLMKDDKGTLTTQPFNGEVQGKG